MVRSIVRTPAAIQDLVDLTAYLVSASQSAALGRRFLAATERSFADLSRQPELGARRRFSADEVGEVRIWPIHGFRSHLIFYRESGAGIEIIRVLHAARDWAALFEPPATDTAS